MFVILDGRSMSLDTTVTVAVAFLFFASWKLSFFISFNIRDLEGLTEGSRVVLRPVHILRVDGIFRPSVGLFCRN